MLETEEPTIGDCNEEGREPARTEESSTPLFEAPAANAEPSAELTAGDEWANETAEAPTVDKTSHEAADPAPKS